MFYPENIEQKIDFTVIREELMRRCGSPLGRERVEAMQMETDYETVSRLLLLTEQMYAAKTDPMLTFPRGEIHDMRDGIARIRIEGLFLDEAELDGLRLSLRYAADLEHFFASLDGKKYGLLVELGSLGAVGSLSGIVKMIGSFSPKRSIRNQSKLLSFFKISFFIYRAQFFFSKLYRTVTASWRIMLLLIWRESGVRSLICREASDGR